MPSLLRFLGNRAARMACNRALSAFLNSLVHYTSGRRVRDSRTRQEGDHCQERDLTLPAQDERYPELNLGCPGVLRVGVAEVFGGIREGGSSDRTIEGEENGVL